MNILWYKTFYVTSNYKTQEQIQVISGTMSILIFPEKFERKGIHCTHQNMVDISWKKSNIATLWSGELDYLLPQNNLISIVMNPVIKVFPSPVPTTTGC